MTLLSTAQHLARDTRTGWEGVRNYQARNFMRDHMQVGDPVLFYASNADPSGVTGLARIARAGYPDPFAWKRGHQYYNAASTPAKPITSPRSRSRLIRSASTILPSSATKNGARP